MALFLTRVLCQQSCEESDCSGLIIIILLCRNHKYKYVKELRVQANFLSVFKGSLLRSLTITCNIIHPSRKEM